MGVGSGRFDTADRAVGSDNRAVSSRIQLAVRDDQLVTLADVQRREKGLTVLHVRRQARGQARARATRQRDRQASPTPEKALLPYIQ